MAFKWGSADDYQDERFVTIAEATEILGLKTRSRVLRLIQDGTLTTYRLPDTARVRIKKSQLLQTSQPKTESTHE